METLPKIVSHLPDDVVDRVAKEVAAQVRDHIEHMYPDAARAVAWKSASLSIQGVVRNTMSSAGRAAEEGRIEEWFAETRKNRLSVKRVWDAVYRGRKSSAHTARISENASETPPVDAPRE